MKGFTRTTRLGSTGGPGSMKKKGSSGKKQMDFEKQMLASEDNYLQSEYITNLQQQIYFLELELQVMKEKQASGRFAGKSSLSNNAPIDTHMNSLRDKYTSMEKKYKKKIKKLEMENDELQMKNEELCKELQREKGLSMELTQSINVYEENQSKTKTINLSEKLKLEKKIDKLTTKFDEKSQLYEQTCEKYRNFRVESRKDNDVLKYEIEDLKKEMTKQNEQVSKIDEQRQECQVKLIETEENNRLLKQDLSELKEENLNNKDKIREWEHKYKKLEMDCENERENISKIDNINRDLRQKITSYENEIETLNEKISSDKKLQDKWSVKIIEAQNENENLLNEKKSLQIEMNDLKQNRLLKVTEDFHRLNESINDQKDKMSHITEINENLQNSIKKIEDINMELKKENILLTDKCEKYETEVGEIKDINKKYLTEKEKLSIECQTLKQRLSVSNKLENIDLSQFKSLCNTNLQIADSIKHLMSTIQNNENIDQSNNEFAN